MVKTALGRIPIAVRGEGVHKDVRVFAAETKIIPGGCVLDVAVSYTRAFNANGEDEGYLFEPKMRWLMLGDVEDP